MIQRKQTLFLLAAGLIAISTLFVPAFGLTISSGEPQKFDIISALSSEIITSNIYYPFVLAVLAAILSFITIFLYKNRVLQYKLANVIVLLSVFTMGLFFLLDMVNVSVDELHFDIGAFLPVATATLAFLAGHFIKKDELLVRSSNRIR